jgi:hypothetical protein
LTPPQETVTIFASKRGSSASCPEGKGASMSLNFLVRSAIAAAAFGFAAVAAVPASAGAAAGTLVCHSPQPQGFFLISARNYDCTFTPVAGPRQQYRATLYRAGAEAGVNSNVTLVWAVFSLTGRSGPGELAGSYGGASAGAAIGVGARANALVGGFYNSFALQPVSVEGETGVNVVASITGLALQEVVYRGRHSRR